MSPTATATLPTLPQIPDCDFRPPAYQGPSREEVIALRRNFVSPGVFHYYREPLMLVDGHRQYLFDERGRRYLDLFAGIVSVSCGHGHPKITRAIQDQVARLAHTTTIYLHPNLALFAERLVSKMPPGLDTVYFVNSGSEANDLALTMARLATGHRDIVCVRNGYHGGVGATMGLTSMATWKYPSQASADIHHAICPDPYRSPFSGTAGEVAEQAARDIGELIRYSTPGVVAGFLAEPIQGAGGVTMGAAGYLRRAYEIVRAHGGLCIADEVQTGFGRTGENFWGFEHFGVVPDIVTMAKSIGNGLPLAAVVTRREIADTLTQRLHFNTFGGNPVAMAAGLAVLEVIEEEGLQDNAQRLGARFRSGLERLAERHPLIGDVRGLGLLLGVELVTDRASRAPGRAAAAAVLEHARDLGVLIGKGGIDGNVLRITPPLCLTAADVDFGLEVLELALLRAASQG